MTKLTSLFVKLQIWKDALRQDTKGQDLAEYALMGGFLAAASGFTMPQVATGISHVLTALSTTLSSAAGPSCHTRWH